MGEGKGNGSGSVVVRQVSSIGSSSLWSSLSPRGLYRTREWPAEWGLEFIIRPRAPRRSQKQWENERGSSPARQRSRATLACRSPLSRPRSRSRVLHSLSLSLSRRPCGWSATRWRRASWTIDHRDAIVHACTYESRISLRLQCVRFNAYSIRGNGSNNAVDRGSWYIGSSDRSRWLTP